MNDNTLRIDPREPGADIRMMKTPDLWPHGAFLPIKRRGGTLTGGDDGLLLAVPGFPRATVFLLNMLDRRRRMLLIDPAKAVAELGIDYLSYDDLEAVYDAGWRVD